MALDFIKLSLSIFDNRKIKYLEGCKAGDTMVICWMKLLTLAGKCNDCGKVYVSPEVPYTTKTLAYELRRSQKMVKTFLEETERLGMIEIEPDGTIIICGWSKYQNTEKLDAIREQNRQRQAAYKERQQRQRSASSPEKSESSTLLEETNVTDNVISNAQVTLPVTQNNVTDNVTGNAKVTLGNAPRIREKKEENREGREEAAASNRYSNVTDNVISNAQVTLPVTQNNVTDNSNLYEFYQQKLGGISSTNAEKLRCLIDEVGETICREAIQRAAEANARSYRYVETVARGLHEGNDFRAGPKKSKKNDLEALKARILQAI